VNRPERSDDVEIPKGLVDAVVGLVGTGPVPLGGYTLAVQVRGDLGIALAFQHRARTVLDARVTGTEPDRPWRFVLMPQPEEVTLEVLIDALGIHFYSLRRTSDTMDRLWERLPSGDRAPGDADADAVLASSAHTALISVSHWEDDGTRETHDVVLAQDGERCHVFLRDPEQPSRLVGQGLDDDEWRELVTRLAVPRQVA